MKYYLIISFVLLFMLIQAADEPAAKPSFKRLYIYAGTTLGVANGTAYINTKNVSPHFAYSTGIGFGVNINPLLSLETGIRYSQKQSATKSYTPYYHEMGFCQTWFAPYNVIGTYKYIDIPLMLNITLGKKRLSAIISAGTDFNFIIEKKIMHTLSPADNSPTATYNDNVSTAKFNISPTLGIGLNYKISEQLFLRIMPVAQFQAFNNYSKGNYTPLGKERLWTAGISTSINFGFLNSNRHPQFKYGPIINGSGTNKLKAKPKYSAIY